MASERRRDGLGLLDGLPHGENTKAQREASRQAGQLIICFGHDAGTIDYQASCMRIEQETSLGADESMRERKRSTVEQLIGLAHSLGGPREVIHVAPKENGPTGMGWSAPSCQHLEAGL